MAEDNEEIEETVDDLYEDLAVVEQPGSSVVAVHTRTGWRSGPLPDEKSARAEFNRYVAEHPEAAIAEPGEEVVLPGPLPEASDADLLAEVDRRGLLRDAEEVPGVDKSVSDQLGWVNAVKDDEEAYRSRAQLILSRELDRDEDDQRKTLKSALTEIVESDDEEDDDEADESPPDDGDGE